MDIIAGYQSALAAIKILKTAADLSTDVKVNQAVIDLQTSLLEIQSQMVDQYRQMEELTKIKNEAEQKLREHEDWNKIAANYEAREWIDGLIVYALKSDSKTGEPSHYLCPHCFQKRKKSFLQKQRANSNLYRCQECGFDVVPTRPSAIEVRRERGFSRGDRLE
jgi:predicted RNA-binding Zn-ribbon protein involved in translation (DUF1610 family)